MTMNLIMIRRRVTELSTQGAIFLDNHRECFTLEPPQPIQEGTYQISLYPSPRFKMIVPMLMQVPNHSEIEIHPGNFPYDTSGCILIGLNRAPDYVGQSRIAFNRLMDKIQGAVKSKEAVEISISTQLYKNGEGMVFPV